jgi:hypothetical protein
MPQYAVIGRHEANRCSKTSKATREAAKKADGGLEELLKQEHAKLLLNLHLVTPYAEFLKTADQFPAIYP